MDRRTAGAARQCRCRSPHGHHRGYACKGRHPGKYGSAGCRGTSARDAERFPDASTTFHHGRFRPDRLRHALSVHTGDNLRVLRRPCGQAAPGGPAAVHQFQHSLHDDREAGDRPVQSGPMVRVEPSWAAALSRTDAGPHHHRQPAGAAHRRSRHQGRRNRRRDTAHFAWRSALRAHRCDGAAQSDDRVRIAASRPSARQALSLHRVHAGWTRTDLAQRAAVRFSLAAAL